MIPQVLDPENIDDFVWADFGYADAQYEELLEGAGCESRIHKKGSRFHPLSEEAKERNKVQSTAPARVAYVFGAGTTQGRLKVCPYRSCRACQHWVWSAGLTATDARNPFHRN